MTVEQLFRECQKLKLQGYGDFKVYITDFTDEPPVPEPLKSVKVRESLKKVFLQSITLQELVANSHKEKQMQANDSKI